ncbi:unnamed protein product [Allacma fusca]|uniref:Uncharacterized protein n=1 Tax=Allacma fusca TaxID=39272 RepID=A0A8J2LKY5_9HEXA|nr:unnamed protein product [Allacma fusca]
MKRGEVELKRELQIKSQTIDDLRQENMTRMGHMQHELSQALLMKSHAEQELINTRLQVEKVERDGKQEVAKLQVN